MCGVGEVEGAWMRTSESERESESKSYGDSALAGSAGLCDLVHQVDIRLCFSGVIHWTNERKGRETENSWRVKSGGRESERQARLQEV